MSNESKFVAGSIEEILVALASGISDAQEQLNRLEPFDAYGRPRPQYHLPYLDFALKVNIQSVSTTVPAASGQITQTVESSALNVAPPAAIITAAFPNSSSSGRVASEITSTLSGRFISVPPNDGMPQVSLSASIKKLSDGSFEIKAVAGRSDGQPVIGGQVEFNVDAGLTQSANPAMVAAMPLGSALIGAGIVSTDTSGIANSTINLASITDAKLQKLFIRVQLGLLSATIMIDRKA
jgi:hypothetical protein